MKQDSLLEMEDVSAVEGPVECLGQTFENDDARRRHFTGLLREKLNDPEFKKIEGFPIGTDEAILELSDPPYYTACPNPWLGEIVDGWKSTKQYRNAEAQLEPFTADVSVGKTDPLYMAHSYHTKVPHKAVIPSVLHYTKPGDIILDGFSGSGMVGVAVNCCASNNTEFSKELEAEWKSNGKKPLWGQRRVILNDLSPAATFINVNYNAPVDSNTFFHAGTKILNELKDDIGWMYKTLHTDNLTEAFIEYTVWSQIFSCNECVGEINFYETALDSETKKVKDTFSCPHCSTSLTKRKLERVYVNEFDPGIGKDVRKIKRVPVLISYKLGKERLEKKPDKDDFSRLDKINLLELEHSVPKQEIPRMHMTHERARMDYSGITHVHHFYLNRSAIALGKLWEKVSAYSDKRIRSMLFFWIEQAVWGMSLLNRYQPIQHGRTGGSQVNRQMSGVYYVSSQISECSPWYNLENKLKRLTKVFSSYTPNKGSVAISTGSVSDLPVQDNSIDYIFTDPPFGENIYYSDLNYLIESWHHIFTNSEPEAIVNRCTKKDIVSYQSLMQSAFTEYYRVLKPGSWMTVVFSNSKASVWNAIQVSLQQAGFVVAEVTALDKKQGSYRQVTSTTAVKQDLVISAYKVSEDIELNFERDGGFDSVIDFIRFHIAHLPVFKVVEDEIHLLPERTAKVLFDRMVAWYIRHNKPVPMSASEFHELLKLNFSIVDGMFFLPEQKIKYQEKRSKVNKFKQIEIFVNNEASTIDWLKVLLLTKPMTEQEIQPLFLKEIITWEKNEKQLELFEVLVQNFLKYEGEDDVPSQIHSYLSTNFKDTRGLEKDDVSLKARAIGRWYIPDSRKVRDIEKLRLRSLLNEFKIYKETKVKVKQPRAEALRAGFNASWENQDFQTILNIAEKIPPAVIQEDEKLLMFYDNALTLTSNQDDDWD
jgi:hypothetical protein